MSAENDNPFPPAPPGWWEARQAAWAREDRRYAEVRRRIEGNPEAWAAMLEAVSVLRRLRAACGVEDEWKDGVYVAFIIDNFIEKCFR